MSLPQRMIGLGSTIMALVLVGLCLSSAGPAHASPIEYVIGQSSSVGDPLQVYVTFTLDPELGNDVSGAFTSWHGVFFGAEFTLHQGTAIGSCVRDLLGTGEDVECHFVQDLGPNYGDIFVFFQVRPFYNYFLLDYWNVELTGNHLQSRDGVYRVVSEPESGPLLMIGLLALAVASWWTYREN